MLVLVKPMSLFLNITPIYFIHIQYVVWFNLNNYKLITNWLQRWIDVGKTATFGCWI